VLESNGPDVTLAADTVSERAPYLFPPVHRGRSAWVDGPLVVDKTAASAPNAAVQETAVHRSRRRSNQELGEILETVERGEREVEVREWNECLRARHSAWTLASRKYLFCNGYGWVLGTEFATYLIKAA
jgi:hypothetical protein